MAAKPQNAGLWGRAKAAARAKFDVYPCVPLHSLAITPHGLCTHEELIEGDSILAYDRNTKSLTWSKVLSINYFEDAPLLRLHKRNGFNLTCTPNHNWVVQRSSICPDKLVESESLNTHMNIVWTGNPLEGDGLRNFLWRKHEDWIPKILQMSPDQREVFLASAIIYDGCDQGPSAIRPNGRTFGFTQKNGNHYMATVLAAFCNGYYVSMYQKTSDIRGATIIRGKRTHSTQNLLKEPAGSAAVWCPTTAHETWVMVQDGVICVTGNSAYANAWASKWYKSHGGKWSGDDNRVAKASGGGLGKWFSEDWKDVKTGKDCGRIEGEKGKRPYPACRPAAAAASMTSQQKRTMARKKTGPARKSWPVSPSGERKED